MKQPHARTDYTVVITTNYDVDGYPETQAAPVAMTVTPGSTVPAEARHAYGFIGRPNDADQQADGTVVNGAFVRTETEGSTLHSFALDDPRVTNLLPQIGKGASMHYGAAPGKAVPSLCLHDGQGNYLVQVPAGSKITITVANGTPIVVEGATVKVGNGPVALALGDALQQLIAGLQAFTTATKAAAVEPTLGPASTDLDLIVQAIVDIKTIQLLGT